MSIWIGTSGWHYRHWRGGLYPPSLPTGRWLAHYAERFATVEMNNAFYRLPERDVFARWAAVVPDDFVAAVKASRYLTHVRRLHDPAEPVARLMARAEALGPKLGPILLQLPPTLPIDLEDLSRALRAFPRGVRVTVEFRHPSWFVAATRRVLEEKGVTLCLTDTAGRHPPLWRTADWGYLRLHAGRAAPSSCYGRQALDTWAGRLANLWPDPATVFVYFNNDAHGCAPRDARRMAAAATRAGLRPTRVPPAHDVALTDGEVGRAG